MPDTCPPACRRRATTMAGLSAFAEHKHARSPLCGRYTPPWHRFTSMCSSLALQLVCLTASPSTYIPCPWSSLTFGRAVTGNPNAPTHVCLTNHRSLSLSLLATSTLYTTQPKPACRFPFFRAATAVLPEFCTRTHTYTRGVEPLSFLPNPCEHIHMCARAPTSKRR
jgi:hypothetical protein